MKKIFFLFCFAASCLQGFSQTGSKDSVTKLIAAEICKEINANEATLMNSDNWQMDLGLLMMPVYSKYLEVLEKVRPGFTMDGPGIEGLSKEIGLIIGLNCPSFLKVLSSDKKKMHALVKEDKLEKSLRGVLLKVETGEFTCVHIKMPNGKIEKVWWMEYFGGANLLLEKGRLNKEIVMMYKEQDIYNAGLEEYVKAKVAVGASF
jgi:hypothetical protein